MKSQNKWGPIFILPFIIGSLVFFLFPVIFSAYISFTKWDLFNPPKWIGLKNWINVLQEPAFWLSFRNMFFFAAIFVSLQTIFALIIAYFLNQNIRGKSLYRLFYFLPVVTPWVAGVIVWQSLYSYDFGIINYVLRAIGLQGSYWLDSDSWMVAFASVALMNVWKGMGQSMVMFLAGLQNVPGEVIEAAHIDGANKRQIFLKIITPIISPMVFLVIVLSTIASFTAFDLFFTAFGVYPPDWKLVVNMMIYRDAFVYSKMGPASAMAWALFAVILVITIIQKKFEKRLVHYEN